MISKRLHPASFSNVNAQLAQTAKSARVYNNANISVANSSWQALTFNSERFDTDTIHDISTNPSRLTCKTAGKYVVSGCVVVASNATGLRYIAIRKNGSSIAENATEALNGAGTRLIVSTIVDLAINDYVELFVNQTSGGALNVTYSDLLSPEFSMARIM